MSLDFSELSPPHRLAVAYAPTVLRDGLALLLALDDRLAVVVLNATEPLIAQLKLAWWYDAILAKYGFRPKGEPLLQSLDQLAALRPQYDVTTAAAEIVSAWKYLAAQQELTDDVITQFLDFRATAMFGNYASWAKYEEGETIHALAMGQQWARSDLVGRGVTCNACADVTDLRSARNMRPLSILVMAAWRHSSGGGRSNGFRLIWHALTGW